MITIYIDNQPYRVATDQNLLQACLSLKLDLPYFCWHPAMGSVGACRQCAMTQYADEKDERGRLIVACMTPVTEGMRVSLTGKAERQFREQVISTLMTNHPHDCPVCSEGGECHLQDMTVMTGHFERHYPGTKRTHQNQYLGPLVQHEMNRCIACYRCERFYKDYAGGSDLAAQGSKNEVYFGRQQDGVLESEFAGNLCEVCPTGVFTDKVFAQHYSRKWDLNSTPSICPHCSVGCNLSYSERYGSVRRAVNRYHSDINGYFICDRGRYGHGFANSEKRLSQLHTLGKETDADFSHSKIQHNLLEARTLPLYGISHPNASLETHFAFKQLVDEDKYCPGLTQSELELLRQHKGILKRVSSPSIKDIETADCILVLNEDLSATAPRIALAVRQAVKNKGRAQAQALGIPPWQDSAVQLLCRNESTPLFIVANGANGLDSIATERVCLDSQDVAHFADKLVTRLNPDTSEPESNGLALNQIQKAQLESLLGHLSEAKRPLIITGWQQGQVNDLRVAANLYRALNNPGAMLCIAPGSTNVMSLAPLIDERSLSLEQACQSILNDSEPCSLLIGDLDLYAHVNTELAESCLKKPELVLQLASLENPCIKFSHLCLPCAVHTEQTGHLVNYEGRIQAFYSVTQPLGKAQPAWYWLRQLTQIRTPQVTAGNSQFCEFKALQHNMVEALGLPDDLLSPMPRVKTARGTKRSSGRTAMLANQTVHEPKPLIDETSPYSFTMEGQLACSKGTECDQPFTWSPGWNSNQSVHKFIPETRGCQHKPEHFLYNEKLTQDHLPLNPRIAKPESHCSIVRVDKVFGSEALSLETPQLSELTLPATLFLHPIELKGQQLQVGDIVQCFNGEKNSKLNWLARIDVDSQLLPESVGLFMPANLALPISFESSLHFEKATDEQTQAFYIEQTKRAEDIKAIQKARTQRLLAQDETIPIRLIGMGGGP